MTSNDAPAREPPGGPSRALALWKALRPLEVALMTAFPLAGFLIQRPSIDALVTELGSAIGVFAAGFAVAASAFGYNRLTGAEHDRHNARHEDLTFDEADLRRLVIALGVAGLIGFGAYHPAATLGAGLTLLAGWLYSAPGIRGKERPGLSTGLHVVGSLGFFYAGMGTLTITPLVAVTAGAMALLFATGHFHHELLDVDADRTAGLSTVATRFGVAVSITLGTLGFVAFYVLMGLAWTRGWWPRALAFPFVVAGGVHAVAYVGFMVTRDHPRTAYRYRSFYRALFLAAAAAAAVGLVVDTL